MAELTFRVNTNDREILKEQKSEYRGLRFQDSIVLDIGCHVGYFARNAIEQGAKYVVGYAPHPDNFKLAQQHLEGMPCRLFNMAVVSQAMAISGEMANLYSKVGSKDKSNHSLFVQGGRTGIEVRVVGFEEVLAMEPYSLLKVDIEGGEYALDFSLLPDSIKMVAIEFHFGKKRWKEIDVWRILKDLRSLGFKATKQPKLYGKHWNTTGNWERL